MNTIDPDLLRCFVTVANYGNFTQAGNKLGLTQSGVSLRIKRLEEQLSCRLLERTSRSVSLSVQGQQLLGDAQRIIDLNESVLHRFKQPDTVGHLCIGFADYVIHGTLQSVLARFRRFYPNVTLEVVTGLGLELMPRFEDETLDLVIAGFEGNFKGVEPLYAEPLHWCVSDDFVDQTDEPLPLVSLPYPCSHRGVGIAELEKMGRVWTQVFTGTSIAGIREAACAGLGVAVLPASSFNKNCRRLTAKDGFPELPSAQIGAFLHEQAGEPAEAFLAYFRQESPWINPVDND